MLVFNMSGWIPTVVFGDAVKPTHLFRSHWQTQHATIIRGIVKYISYRQTDRQLQLNFRLSKWCFSIWSREKKSAAESLPFMST